MACVPQVHRAHRWKVGTAWRGASTGLPDRRKRRSSVGDMAVGAQGFQGLQAGFIFHRFKELAIHPRIGSHRGARAQPQLAGNAHILDGIAKVANTRPHFAFERGQITAVGFPTPSASRPPTPYLTCYPLCATRGCLSPMSQRHVARSWRRSISAMSPVSSAPSAGVDEALHLGFSPELREMLAHVRQQDI